jgi:hypothetical protein
MWGVLSTIYSKLVLELCISYTATAHGGDSGRLYQHWSFLERWEYTYDNYGGNLKGDTDAPRYGNLILIKELYYLRAYF